MSIGPFNLNTKVKAIGDGRQPKPVQGTLPGVAVTLRQKRTTYRRLWLICEIYKPDWKAALERARRRVGAMK